MRNIFDQYEQPENKLTHALACTLHGDRNLIAPFLRWAGFSTLPPLGSIQIIEQQVPGEIVDLGDESASAGLPDLCLFTETGWAALFEMKVNAVLKADQLRRHVETAKRYGYDDPRVTAIVVDKPSSSVEKYASVRYWRDLYAWLSKKSMRSAAAQTLVDYMQVFESRMIREDRGPRGTITMFDGINFSEIEPYSYAEAKRVMRLLGDELQASKKLHRIGVDPKGERRSAITGRKGDAVWDFLPLTLARGAGAFTECPHLTMNISRHRAHAAITVPNGIKGGFRTKLKSLGRSGFVEMMLSIEERTRRVVKRSTGAAPFAYVLQRHFKSQRSAGVQDALLRADLRTLIKGGDAGVSYQPEWFDAIYDLLLRKRSNIQFGLEIDFKYGCKVLGSVQAADLFADSWVALAPVLDFVVGD